MGSRQAVSRRRIRSAAVATAALAILAATGCRCDRADPGGAGKAATALSALPPEMDAVLVLDVAALQQGSLGELFYRPLIARQLGEWGGDRCGSLATDATKSAAVGLRFGGGGARGYRVFFAVEGPTIADAKLCIDDHWRPKGLSSSYTEVQGIRTIDDSRGLRMLASGQNVVSRGFPFLDAAVFEELVRAAKTGESTASNAEVVELLRRLGGQVTLALPHAEALVETFREDLEAWALRKMPADACAAPADVNGVLGAAGLIGFGNLPGVRALIDSRFAGAERICVADGVRALLDLLAKVRAGGVAIDGSGDIELALVLVFADEASAADLRGLFGDIIHVAARLPTQLDVIERDWPSVMTKLAEITDVANLRTALRSPVLRHLTVSGEGNVFEFRVRIAHSDARGAMQAIIQLVARSANQ
jgi:hypothetical protein